MYAGDTRYLTATSYLALSLLIMLYLFAKPLLAMAKQARLWRRLAKSFEDTQYEVRSCLPSSSHIEHTRPPSLYVPFV